MTETIDVIGYAGPKEDRDLMTPPEQLTVLTAIGGRFLRKKIYADGTVETYPNVAKFDVHEREVDGIAGLYDLLSKVEQAPSACIIRGERLPGCGTAGVLRRFKSRPGQPATFGAAPGGRRWICIDIDKAPVPADVNDPTSKAAIKRCISDVLDGEFDGIACVYQWSSSAGLDGWNVFKLHVWFWLDRPLCDDGVRQLLKGYEHVDTSLYHPIQIHYTAPPEFLDGAEDPVKGERTGMIPGLAEYEVPFYVMTPEDAASARQRAAERRAEAALAPRGPLPPRLATRRDARAAGALRSAAGRVREAPPGTRHDVLIAEACGLGRLIGGGEIEEETARAALLSAWTDAVDGRTSEARRSISDAFEAGKQQPKRLE